MSAGVSDQRMKGQGNQVSNGPKEQLGAGEGATGSEEFEPWRTQQQNSAAHTAYGTSAVPISTATDLYSMSTAGYYGSGGTYPYQAYGVGDGTWSNGTADPMTFLGTYAAAAHDSYSMDGGMFGPPSTTFSTPTAFAAAAAAAGPHSSFYNFHSNGDYSTWGGSQPPQQRKYDDYYRGGDAPNQMYQPQGVTAPDPLKTVEQAMQNLDLKAVDVGSNKDSGGGAKKTTWASIASQPAKPPLSVQSGGLKKKGPGMPPGPIVPGKHNMDIGTWDTSKSTPPPTAQMVSGPPVQPPPQKSIVGGRGGWNAQGPLIGRHVGQVRSATQQPPSQHAMQTYQQQQQGLIAAHLNQPVSVPTHHGHIQNLLPTQVPMLVQSSSTTGTSAAITAPTHPVLDELRGKNNYNPPEFDLSAPNGRFFVIKSYSEDDIHRSIKYEIWCSTEHGNKRLDQAYREREGNGAVYLFFSVNGSGHFCGMAQMVSAVDYHANSSVWSQDKWKGQFKVRWIYVKDVPNVQLRHIRLENNDNKPVTNSRDTQEVPHPKGLAVLRIIHAYRHSTSIFDDFVHYEKRQEEEDNRKQPPVNSGKDNPDNPGGAREHRERGGRTHDRDSGHRNNDHHGGHHKERSENSRGRGRGGRN